MEISQGFSRTQERKHRPISLISIIRKVFYRCVLKYFNNYLLYNHILTPFQTGFVHGDSTINQILYLTNKIFQASDDGIESCAIF